MTGFLTGFMLYLSKDGGKEAKVEKASSMFPLFSLVLLTSDLHRDKTGRVKKWESCGFPVITQSRSSQDSG